MVIADPFRSCFSPPPSLSAASQQPVEVPPLARLSLFLHANGLCALLELPLVLLSFLSAALPLLLCGPSSRAALTVSALPSPLLVERKGAFGKCSQASIRKVAKDHMLKENSQNAEVYAC